MRWLLALVLCCIPALAWAGYNEPVTCAQTPALTGDTTTPVGSCVTTNTLHKISTVTASASASAAWTGLATYSIYQLSCASLFASGVVALYLQVGEGGTPTWETTGYRWGNRYVGSDASTGVTNNASDSGIALTTSSGVLAGSINFTGYLYNVTSTTAIKTFTANVVNHASGVSYGNDLQGSYTTDTNAVTALRIIPSSGTVTGTCTLYGIGQ
jgi:hypothetical protein